MFRYLERSRLEWLRVCEVFNRPCAERINLRSVRRREREKDGGTNEEKGREIPLDVGRKVRRRNESETRVRKRRSHGHNKPKSPSAVVSTWKKRGEHAREEDGRIPDDSEREGERR